MLWQVGLEGDLSMSVAPSGRSRRRLLIDKLPVHSPARHPVVLEEAAVLPVERHLRNPMVHADEALDQAKHDGRNRVARYDEALADAVRLARTAGTAAAGSRGAAP